MFKFRNILPFRISRHALRAIAWSAFLVFFITVCIPLLSFYYLFNPVQVKQLIISQFNDKNYAVVIDGNVEPHSWHGLSLFISDLTVEDKQRHKVLHINTANCQLSWLDLIIGHYKIKRMALNGLTFYRSSANTFHYNDLLNYDIVAKSAFNGLINLSITNLNLVESADNFIIRDASLYLLDLPKQPSVTLSFNVAKYHAQINLQGQVSTLENGKFILRNLSTHVETPLALYDFQSNASYDYVNQDLWLDDTRGAVAGQVYNGSINVDKVLVSGYGITANNFLASINKASSSANQNITINASKISTSNFYDYRVEQLATNFTTANSAQRLELKLKLFDSQINRNLDVTNQSCKLGFDYRLNDIPGAEVNGVLDGQCSYIESSQMVNLSLSGKVDDAPANLKFQYEHRLLKDQIRVTGAIDTLDLSKLMANGKGNILPFYTDTTPLPLSWLKWFDLDASLELKQLKLSHFNLTNVHSRLVVESNNFDLTELHANIYDGTVAGSLAIINQGESYQVSIKNQISNVNLQKMFDNLFNVSAITGRANVLIDTTANGVVNYQDLHSKLNGKIELGVSNGGFSGVDFSLFLSPENLAAFQSRSSLMTSFTTLKSNFVFKDGISQEGTLSFSSPSILAAGSGLIDFVNTKLNYKLKVSSILPPNLQNIKSISIPVLINGDLFNPQIYIQNMTLNTEDNKAVKSRRVRK